MQVDKSTQKITNAKTTAVNKMDTTPIAPIKMVQNTAEPGDTLDTKPIPKDIDKQLQVIYKTGIADLQNMPFWLKALGGKKAIKDFTKIVENKDFKKKMDEIFQSARDKKNNQNADVIELVRDKDVLDKVFDCLKTHSEKGTLVNALLGLKIVKEKFSENVKNNQHRYLLYGE